MKQKLKDAMVRRGEAGGMSDHYSDKVKNCIKFICRVSLKMIGLHIREKIKKLKGSLKKNQSKLVELRIGK